MTGYEEPVRDLERLVERLLAAHGAASVLDLPGDARQELARAVEAATRLKDPAIVLESAPETRPHPQAP